MTTSFLFAVGDVAAQQLVDKKGLEKHDLARTGRMALYGGGKRPFEPPTSPLYPPSSFPLSRLPHPSILLNPPPFNSRLRPRRSDLVQSPLAARQPAVAQRDHPRARGLRPGPLRADLHRGVPEQHGGAGGVLAAGEAGKELLGRAAHQLDDLAVCADGQLQARAAAAPAAVRQRHQHRVELLLEFLE